MSLLDAIVAWTGPSGWDLFAWRTPAGLLVTAGFAIGARLLRAVTLGGAIAGAIVTFLLWSAHPGAFLAELAVFLLTWSATRAGYRRKQQLGAAESGRGRSASQVLANLSVATASALAATCLHQPWLMFGCAAALAEAAADTVSSELGQAIGGVPLLITSLRRVPVGTDGGITAAGTSAGIAAALVISGIAVLTGLIPSRGLAIPLLAGTAGMFCDSLLGATLERSRVLDNDRVNGSSTLFAAAVAVILVRFWP